MDFEKAAEMDSLGMESRLRRHYQREQIAGDFVTACKLIAQGEGSAKALREDVQHRQANRFYVSTPLGKMVEKAVTASLDDAWGDTGGRELAANYLRTVENIDALSIISRYATPVPLDLHHVIVASGFGAGAVGEALPKVVREAALAGVDIDPVKLVAFFVMTKELLDAAGDALFRRELENGVVGNGSQTTAEIWRDFGTVAASSGSDFRSTLSNMLAAAEGSQAYILYAPSGAVQSLVADPDASNMTPLGGEFAPGVFVLPWSPGSNDSDLLLCPLSRAAIKDYGLSVRSARHASIDMSDSPSSPAEQVSLWQSNCVGLLVERSFALSPAAPAVTAELPA